MANNDEIIEKLEKAIRQRPLCQCGDCWTGRNMHSPDCCYAETFEEFELVDQALALLKEKPKTDLFTGIPVYEVEFILHPYILVPKGYLQTPPRKKCETNKKGGSTMWEHLH